MNVQKCSRGPRQAPRFECREGNPYSEYQDAVWILGSQAAGMELKITDDESVFITRIEERPPHFLVDVILNDLHFDMGRLRASGSDIVHYVDDLKKWSVDRSSFDKQSGGFNADVPLETASVLRLCLTVAQQLE